MQRKSDNGFVRFKNIIDKFSRNINRTKLPFNLFSHFVLTVRTFFQQTLPTRLRQYSINHPNKNNQFRLTLENKSPSFFWQI